MDRVEYETTRKLQKIVNKCIEIEKVCVGINDLFLKKEKPKTKKTVTKTKKINSRKHKK